MRPHRQRSTSLAVLFLLATAPTARSQAGPAATAPPDTSGLPLAPARWSRFTTDHGTWLSLDVSPDGRTIVFDLLGDLYTVPITGGEATRLTSGIAHDMQPRFSPDGSRVVFVSDRSGDENVWILTLADGHARPLTKGVASGYLSPEWAPDGQYIVVSRAAPLQGLEKLWLFHIDGGTGLPLVRQPGGLRMMGPAFGPSERYVYYAQRFGSWQYNAVLPQYQLGVYDREAGIQTTIRRNRGQEVGAACGQLAAERAGEPPAPAVARRRARLVAESAAALLGERSEDPSPIGVGE